MSDHTIVIIWVMKIFFVQFFGNLLQYSYLENPMTEDEMVEWHHRLDGREFEQALRVGDGQRSLACCSLWGHKE